jgi:hypothetical protein
MYRSIIEYGGNIVNVLGDIYEGFLIFFGGGGGFCNIRAGLTLRRRGVKLLHAKITRPQGL